MNGWVILEFFNTAAAGVQCIMLFAALMIRCYRVSDGRVKFLINIDPLIQTFCTITRESFWKMATENVHWEWRQNIITQYTWHIPCTKSHNATQNSNKQ